jgi:DnaJ-class molecular chaperone
MSSVWEKYPSPEEQEAAEKQAAKAACTYCHGSGRIETGPPLGTCDGPQFGTCPKCNGSGLAQ